MAQYNDNSCNVKSNISPQALGSIQYNCSETYQSLLQNLKESQGDLVDCYPSNLAPVLQYGSGPSCYDQN